MDVGRLRDYLAKALGRPGLTVTGLYRIPGGASRATWSVDTDDDGHRQGLVVRLDPDASLLDSNRNLEFGLYRVFAGVPGVPVPQALVNEDDREPLGHPFFVMAKVDGRSDTSIPEHLRETIAAQKMRILAAISTADWRSLGLDALLDEPQPEDCWRRELDMWEAVIDANDLGPLPITRAAIRRLRRRPPPPPERICLVHADYRTGNFLYDDSGTITAILDWEMAHLGDPHEDLAWTSTRNWRWDATRPDLVGGVLTQDEATARWEAASGIRVDRESLDWWLLFSHVKANAIWLTGAYQFALGRTQEMLLPLIPWIFVNRQEGWMLDGMGITAERHADGPTE